MDKLRSIEHQEESEFVSKRAQNSVIRGNLRVAVWYQELAANEHKWMQIHLERLLGIA